MSEATEREVKTYPKGTKVTVTTRADGRIEITIVRPRVNDIDNRTVSAENR